MLDNCNQMKLELASLKHANAELRRELDALLKAAEVVSRWADDCSPTDCNGSEQTGAWLSFEGQEAIDGLRKAIKSTATIAATPRNEPKGSQREG